MSERPANIPAEHWRRLGDTCHIEMGQSPPSAYVFEGLDDGLPFLQGNAEFGEPYPTPIFSCAAPAKVGQAGSVLISVRAPVGAVNLADRDYCIGRGLAAILPRRYPPTFIAAAVNKRSEELARVSQGTTFEAIGKRELHNLEVYSPDLPIAVKIAEVLDTLDAAIRGTEAVVAKLRAMKQGLLHDLLTRGIDAHGDLRPPQPEAPHLYHQTPLGWLPKEWGIVTVKDLARSSVIGPFGSDLVASDYRSEGVPVVFVRDIKPDAFAWKSNVFLHERKALALSAHRVTAGDVVATKMGFPPCIAAVYPSEMPDGIITADVVCIRPNLGIVLPAWLSTSMNSPRVQRQVDQITAGVTRPKVTLRDVRELKVAMPTLEEQSAIIERLSAIDAEIGMNNGTLDKLRLQKSGLMDDLLTGRVPVTPLL